MWERATYVRISSYSVPWSRCIFFILLPQISPFLICQWSNWHRKFTSRCLETQSPCSSSTVLLQLVIATKKALSVSHKGSLTNYDREAGMTCGTQRAWLQVCLTGCVLDFLITRQCGCESPLKTCLCSHFGSGCGCLFVYLLAWCDGCIFRKKISAWFPILPTSDPTNGFDDHFVCFAEGISFISQVRTQ